MDPRQENPPKTILHRDPDDESLFVSAVIAGACATASFGLLPFPVLSTFAWAFIPTGIVAAWVFTVLTARKGSGAGSSGRFVLLAASSAAAPTLLAVMLLVWRFRAWPGG